MYDAVSRLQMPEGVKLIVFGDNLVVVDIVKHWEQVTQEINEMVATIQQWVQDSYLKLANHKIMRS